MFSGVGPLAISAAKKVKYVYANDINPNAVGYLERNMVLNKLEKKIEVLTETSGRNMLLTCNMELFCLYLVFRFRSS
jgi:tRNA (guanine37-N1)-methyltransferase